MNKRIGKGLIFIFLMVLFWSNVYPTIAQALMPQQATIDDLTKQSILTATIQITMFPQEEGVTQSSQYMVTKGLGTIVHYGDETFIVTHDHWDQFVLETSQVEFRDAYDSLLSSIDGIIFRSLIRYRDAGTLILTLPTTFNLEAINEAIVAPEEVRPGTVVLVTRHYQAADGARRVAILPAIVTAVDSKQERPILILRSLNGESIIQGDSGGGVWLNGRLIGNMWATEVQIGWQLGRWSVATGRNKTDASIVAKLPLAAFSNTVNDPFNQQDVESPLGGVLE